MTTPSLGRLILQARLAGARLGAINGVACALAALGLFAWLLALPALRAQEAAVGLALADAQQVRRTAAAPALADTPPFAADGLARFEAALGDAAHAERSLKTLFAIADKSGLQLNLAEYQLAEEDNGHYQTYRILLPVKGTYATIRRFCAQTLLSIPYAALNEIGFKRDAVASPKLEARLRFTLYLSRRPHTLALAQAEAAP